MLAALLFVFVSLQNQHDFANGKTADDPSAKDHVNVLYMEDHCRVHFYNLFLDNRHVYVDSGVLLKLSSNPAATRTTTCVATFTARNPGQRLLLHFEKVAINYHLGTLDKLHIYDGINADTDLTSQDGLYGKYAKGNYEFSNGNIHDYISHGKAMTLFFIGMPTTAFPGFEVVLTAITEPYGNGTCRTDLFQCNIHPYCIDKSLVCDGQQNCGEFDRSDELDCAPRVPHSKSASYSGQYELQDLGLLMGCGLSILILLVVILWLGVICLRRVSLRQRRHRLFWSSLAVPEASQPPHDPPPTLNLLPASISGLGQDPPPTYTEHAQDLPGMPEDPLGLPPPYTLADHLERTGLMSDPEIGTQVATAMTTTTQWSPSPAVHAADKADDKDTADTITVTNTAEGGPDSDSDRGRLSSGNTAEAKGATAAEPNTVPLEASHLPSDDATAANGRVENTNEGR